MTLWRYDAARRDPLTRLRIPVTSMRPLHSYLLALHKESPHRPSAVETEMLCHFIDEKKHRMFTGAERQLMDSCPFDTHPGIATVVVHKYGRDDWGFRLATWPMSAFTPSSPRSPRTLGPWSLLEVLDHINSTEGRAEPWAAWKHKHPEVFE